MSRINYTDTKKVHNKNPLYRLPLRTVDFQLITSIGSCLLYLIYNLCKTILLNSVFYIQITFPLDYTSFLLYYGVSIKFLVVRPPFIYFLFDVIIITHNGRNVNTKSDKKYIK